MGGLDMQQQARELARRPHVVIATPGRLRVSFSRSDMAPSPILGLAHLPVVGWEVATVGIVQLSCYVLHSGARRILHLCWPFWDRACELP